MLLLTFPFLSVKKRFSCDDVMKFICEVGNVVLAPENFYQGRS
jgi:hypothetical protein